MDGAIQKRRMPAHTGRHQAAQQAKQQASCQATTKHPSEHVQSNSPGTMYIKLFAISAVLATLASAQGPITTPTTLQQRYTPPPGQGAGCPYICKDYFDDCGNTYGPGCFSSCPGYPEPTYTTPVCNEAVATTTAAPDMNKRYTPPPGESASCPFICKDYFDDCGNTYGPGCFSSCPGYPEPTS